jgi:murein DD-endopeptidase MepM/ murein hydrolase activator NlpD
MNIIIISEGIRKGRAACLSHRQLLLIVLVGGVLLPILLGFVSFRIHELITRHSAPEDRIAAYSKELAQQKRSLEMAKREASTHLNALTRRMGQLQAQVLRLNGLGSRLTRMAGLDRREFNFDVDVAQGGPETGGSGGSIEVAESLEKLSAEIIASEARLKALETLLLHRRLTDAVTPTGWPAEGGFVSSNFGHRADPFTGRVAFHEGVDIAAKMGSPILAMADGVVQHTGDKANYGRVVEINHGNGLVTRYGHALSLLVKEGDTVKRGDAIALVGSSGRSTGPHVHLEVLKDGRPVNPSKYLRPSAFITASKS